MIRNATAFAGLTAVALCGMSGVAAAECLVSVDQSWASGTGVTLAINALSVGPTCDSAALFLTIRDKSGQIQHLDGFDTTSMFGFEAVADEDTLSAALEEWLDPVRLNHRSTATLSPWVAGTYGPEGEFMFIPDQWIDQPLYEALRLQNLPMLCFVQGFESESCLVLESDGILTPFGVQIFPG